MGGVQDDGGRRLVDLAALDAHQPVLDVVDPADPVGRAEGVEPLDELDRVDRLPVERDGDSALEADRRPPPDPGPSLGATVHAYASAGGETQGSSRMPVSHERPHMLTSIE